MYYEYVNFKHVFVCESLLQLQAGKKGPLLLADGENHTNVEQGAQNYMCNFNNQHLCYVKQNTLYFISSINALFYSLSIAIHKTEQCCLCCDRVSFVGSLAITKYCIHVLPAFSINFYLTYRPTCQRERRKMCASAVRRETAVKTRHKRLAGKRISS